MPWERSFKDYVAGSMRVKVELKHIAKDYTEISCM